jgi:hypothetical protein
MDLTIMKKRLNTFKSDKGTLSKVSDDVVMDLLRTWENWPGSAAELYRGLGLSKMQMVILIKKAKRLVKSGAIQASEFKEIKVVEPGPSGGACCIELCWDQGKVIRFAQVELLVDFLKKVA